MKVLKRFFWAAGLLLILSSWSADAADRKIVLVAGSQSHGRGEHEFKAGSLLLAKCLNQVPGVQATVYTNGWPQDTTAFTGASAVVLYMDGGSGHPAIHKERLDLLDKLMKQGVGLACLHFAVEVPKGESGDKFLDWIGGYFEMFWSVNPHWDADFTRLPRHPITHGVKPFKINDEWYYHMRFRENMQGVTPILTAVPPASTLDRPDGPHSGNPHVRAKIGQPQHVAWACERADGGRGFGFTGGHRHANWADENFRKLVLNAVLWIAKADVPEQGVACTVSSEDIKANLDPKGN